MIAVNEQLTRKVVVVGRTASVDAEGLVEDAASRGAALVFLSLGYPVTRAQAELVERATRRSVELGVWFDAVLVLDDEQLWDHLDEGDHVTLAARGRERHRLEGILVPRFPSVGGSS
jgi:hypothetical protein